MKIYFLDLVNKLLLLYMPFLILAFREETKSVYIPKIDTKGRGPSDLLSLYTYKDYIVF